MTTIGENRCEKGFLMETQIRLVHVVFGMPSLNCRRYGLCRIEDRYTLPLTDADIQQQPNTALACMQTEGNYLVFRFLKETMTERDQQKFFSSTHFVISENKPLSKSWTNLWGVKQVAILRGCYRIKKTEKDFTIRVKMQYLPNETVEKNFFQTLKHIT